MTCWPTWSRHSKSVCERSYHTSVQRAASIGIPSGLRHTLSLTLGQRLCQQRYQDRSTQQRGCHPRKRRSTPSALCFHPLIRLRTYHLDSTAAILKDELLERILTQFGYGIPVLGLYSR